MNAISLRVANFWLIGLGFVLATPARCQLSLRVLHSFSGGTDGRQPYAGLVQGSDGALYGTTFQGGSNNAGVVFKVFPDGSGNTPLYSFDASVVAPGGIANPSGLIQGSDGALYGTTGFGGINGYGSVFKINRDGTGYLLLHSFSTLSNGPYEPTAELVQGRDGMLYGTTQFGGAPGHGTVFTLSTNGTGYLTLHEFGLGTDGQSPQSPLMQGLDGALYGTTSLGGAGAQGGASGFGTVFRLATDGTGETVLHSFLPANGDGQNPYTAGLVQGLDGTLYGITQQGGTSGAGTVFKLNPDRSAYSILHTFPANAADGKFPNSTLVLGTDGSLYGTTEMGGTNNVGVLFRLNTHGTSYVVLYHFGSTPGDGANPRALLVQATDGGLFGTTQFGGTYNLGTVFRLAPSPSVISSLISLPDQTVQLTVNAAPNFVLRIEASSDETDWVTLTNIMNPSGTVQFIDQSSPSTPQRFYRAAWVP